MKSFPRNFLLLILGACLLPPALALSAALLYVRAHRDDIAQEIREKTGLALRGDDLHLLVNFSQGIVLRARDLHTPPAKDEARSLQASIKQMDLYFAWETLVHNSAAIAKVAFLNADIKSPKEASPLVANLMAFGKSDIHFVNSRLSLFDQNQLWADFRIDQATLETKKHSVRLRYIGTIGEETVDFSLRADPLKQILSKPWHFKLKGENAARHFFVQGSWNRSAQQVDIERYRVRVADTSVLGSGTFRYDGERPSLQGKAESVFVRLGDIQTMFASVPLMEVKQEGEKLFSFEPFDFSFLKNIDAEIDVRADVVKTDVFEGKKFTAKLHLDQQRLLLSPLSVRLADARAKGQALIDFSAEVPSFSVLAKASRMDFSQLFELGGLEILFFGKGDADVNLTSEGKSPHEIAQNLKGSLNLTMANGGTHTRSLRRLAGMIMNNLFPGAGFIVEAPVNCAVMRFEAQNGILQAQRILLDTMASTFSVSGFIDLGKEELRLKAVAQDAQGNSSAIVPPLKIEGNLTAPRFKTEGTASLEEIARTLLAATSAAPSAPLPPETACFAQLQGMPMSLSLPESSVDPKGLFNSISSLCKNLMDRFWSFLF